MCESKKLVSTSADSPKPITQPTPSFSRKRTAARRATFVPWNRSSSEPMKRS